MTTQTREIGARIDMQFHPQGTGYTYDPKNGADSPTKAAEEKNKIERVLGICDRIHDAFQLLIPADKRTWFEDTLKLKAVDKLVRSADYVAKVNEKLKGWEIKHAALDALRGQLTKLNLVWADGSPFPPAKPPSSPGDGVALNFGVEAVAGRIYYDTNPVSCCGPKSLLLNQKPLRLRDPDMMNGNVAVMLYVHFNPAEGLS